MNEGEIYDKIKNEQKPDYEDVENISLDMPSLFKKNKKVLPYLVENLFPQKEVCGIYGASESLKSFTAFNLAISISEGKPFLNKFKTIKSNVLYFSSENSDACDTDRVRKINKQMRIRLDLRKKNLNFFLISRDLCGDMSEPKFLNKIISEIQKRNAKVIFLDTASNLNISTEGNNASEVMKMFKTFFNIIKETGVTIIYLHHTNKKGDFLGSMKYKANSEVFYELEKDEYKDELLLRSEKTRYEPRNLLMGYSFADKNKFNLFLVKEMIGKIKKNENKPITKLETAKQKILEVLKDKELGYTEISSLMPDVSLSSFKRAMNVLYEAGSIKKNKKGGYYLD